MLTFLKRFFSQPTAESAPVLSVSSQLAAPLPEAAFKQAPPPPPADEPVGEVIQLPLIDIVAKLPAALAPSPSASLTGTFALPLKTALAQLPSGAVRIRFAQLRNAAAPGTFPDDAALDETLVDLPLPKILASVNPALLARRSGQNQIEVPSEIKGIFGSMEKTLAQVALPVSAPAPIAPPAVPKPPAPAPLPLVSQKSSPPLPSPLPPALAEATVTVLLSALVESWAEPVRQEITQSNLNNASVALPMNRLDSAMKTGRIAFTWGELVQWLDVPSAAIVSSQRDTTLELPLKVIAPLFMAQRKASIEQKKIVIGDNIPNLFEGLGKAAAPAPVSAPASGPMSRMVPTTPALAPAANTLGELFGQPAKMEVVPQEITQKINTFPGVAASLIAMSDGLHVAGELAPPLKSETLAAFLPQIFGRMNHYSGEIHLGALSALTLQVGQTPCAILKTGALYLAVVGKSGQTLPDALLQKVAGEMAKRSQ